jgi:hypothetical protein
VFESSTFRKQVIHLDFYYRYTTVTKINAAATADVTTITIIIKLPLPVAAPFKTLVFPGTQNYISKIQVI